MNAPFLELGFYFGTVPGTQAVARLSRWLIERGHDPYRASIALLDDAHENLYEKQIEERCVTSVGELTELLNERGKAVVQVSFRGASEVVSDSDEAVVAQLSVSPLAAVADNCPVAIWLDGSPFAGPSEVTIPGSQSAGRRAFQLFRDAVEDVRPSYGSLTVEYGLECPTDLREDPRSNAFRDFYIARAFIGADRIEQIKAVAAGAYIVEVDHGLFVFCYEAFAPETVAISSSAANALSAAVAQLIANRAPAPLGPLV